MSEQHFQRWMLIVREHLVEHHVPQSQWSRFDWRAQYRDGQTPTAAIRSFLSGRST